MTIHQCFASSRGSYLVDEHDGEHAFIHEFSFPVKTDWLNHCMHCGQARDSEEKNRKVLCLDTETYGNPKILPIRTLT